MNESNVASRGVTFGVIVNDSEASWLILIPVIVTTL